MKTVFITGGSTGIGAASVEKFLAQGWNVGFMDINVKAATELVNKLSNDQHLLFIEGDTKNFQYIVGEEDLYELYTNSNSPLYAMLFSS